MIYLIDDNKYGQMSVNYGRDFTSILKSYSDHIIWLQSFSLHDIDSIMLSASTILIHDSLDENEEKQRLIARAKLQNKSFCVFSNGFTATLFEGDSIKEINKDRLYHNLLTFIDQFKTDGIIDLKLLSLGRNYDTEKVSIIQDRLINGTLFNHKVNFNYEAAFPSGSMEYNDLIELFYLSNPNLDFSTFEDKYNYKETTVHAIRNAILSMSKKVKQKYEL